MKINNVNLNIAHKMFCCKRKSNINNAYRYVKPAQFSELNNSYSSYINFTGAEKHNKPWQYCNPLTSEIYNLPITAWARNDLDWMNFGEYLKDRYPDIEKASIYLYACSTGEEAYTLALLLNKLYPNSDFKIKAFDIDEDRVRTCRNNQKKGVYIEEKQYDELCESLGLDDENKEDCFERNSETKIKLSDSIVSKVEFQEENQDGDIFTSIDEIDLSNPTILLARNMWRYVEPSYYDMFASKLYNKLQPGSIFVTGPVDNSLLRHLYKNNKTFLTVLREKKQFKTPKEIRSSGGKNDKTIRAYVFEKNV